MGSFTQSIPWAAKVTTFSLWYFLIVAGALRCVLYYTFDTKEVLLVSIERRS
jgi:hypothetical protein